MTPYEIIATKRDGRRLTPEAIEAFITGYMNGEVADYQMAALLMAIYLRGMDDTEITALTRAYIRSGKTVDLSDIPGIKVDKHSTGGVGDKVSIVLAPLVASLGVPVPMISGRGLGHSGGTLDKLESIPGFQTDFSIEKFHRLVEEHGLALIGQTDDLVPADRRIYALRDVTATVDSIPLICASIMSKKIAEGIDALVLDVKYGSGAFMRSPEKAEALATNLIRIGREFSKKVVACVTSMEQPLGNYIGNWLEIRECLHCFAGNGPEDLMTVTFTLAGHMLRLGGVADSPEKARELCRESIRSGRAWEKFLEIVRAQGGDTRVLEHPEEYPYTAEVFPFTVDREGYLVAMNTREIGMAAVELGAGRLRAEDGIDPAAGIILHKKVGDFVKTGETVMELHTNRNDRVPAVEHRLRQALTIADQPETIPPLILKEI
ncbi:MAG: thymidine phosphorylase, partial [Calditrichaeota bacterium]